MDIIDIRDTQAGPANRSLAGRIALVTGATGTIGRTVCMDLAHRGASIAIAYRRAEESARALASSLPTPTALVRADLSDEAGVEEAVSLAEGALGTVGILVNAVHAPNKITPVAALTSSLINEQLASVVSHALLCSRVIPGMRASGWGRIVYVSGALMARPAPGFAAYGAAKAAASTYTRYLALEEGRAGITANIVAPGRVVDPQEDEALDAERRALAHMLLERTALGSFPTPDDVATSIGDLVTSPGITGQTIWVTGGEHITA